MLYYRINIFLYLIYAGILILLILILTTNVKNYQEYNSILDLGQIKSKVDDCTVAIDDVPQFQTFTDCGDGTRQVSIGEVNYLVQASPTYYITACMTACSNGLDTDGSCIGGVGGNTQTACINLTRPSCKSSANPVLRDGTNLYYIKRVGVCPAN